MSHAECKRGTHFIGIKLVKGDRFNERVYTLVMPLGSSRPMTVVGLDAVMFRLRSETDLTQEQNHAIRTLLRTARNLEVEL